MGSAAKLASPAMSTSSRTASTGTPAPDFTLPRVGGGEVSLASYRGQPVVLAFLRGFS
jgi:peroxiredoxin